MRSYYIFSLRKEQISLRKEQILHPKFYVAKGSEVFSRTVAETSKSTIIFRTVFPILFLGK